MEEKRKLPKGWKWVKLGEVCEQNIETRDPRKESDISFTYIDISSINNNKSIAEPKNMKGSDAPSRARKVVQSGDVIVSTTRPNLNAVALISKEYDKQICSTGFCVLRPERDILDSQYLFRFVQSFYFVNKLSDLVKGALYPAVTDGQVYEQDIPLPPLQEQQRIVSVLTEKMSAIEKARAAAQAQLEAAKALPGAYLREVFESEEAKNWPEIKFENIAFFQRGYDLPIQNRIPGEYPIVTSSGINGYHNVYLEKNPGVVTGRSGSIGKVHFVEHDYWPHNTSLFVKNFKGNIPKYIYYLLQYIDLERLSNSTGVPTLDRKMIHKLPVRHVKDIHIQHQIVSRLDNKMSCYQRLLQIVTEQLDTINALPASYLRKAFNGEL